MIAKTLFSNSLFENTKLSEKFTSRESLGDIEINSLDDTGSMKLSFHSLGGDGA